MSYMILEDNAKKLQHNVDVLKSRKNLLERTMAFRRPKGAMQQSKFRRGFKATYGNVEKVDEIRGSTVIPRGDGDAPTDIKRVMPVHPQSDDVEARFGMGDAFTERKKSAVWPLMMSLHIILQEGEQDEISFSTAARKLKDEFGETEYLQMLKDGYFEHLSDAVHLFPDEFTVTRLGYWIMLTPEFISNFC